MQLYVQHFCNKLCTVTHNIHETPSFKDEFQQFVCSALAALLPPLTCQTSSDLLQQIRWEEAQLSPCADLQVAVDLLTLLHYNLGNEEE